MPRIPILNLPTLAGAVQQDNVWFGVDDDQTTNQPPTSARMNLASVLSNSTNRFTVAADEAARLATGVTIWHFVHQLDTDDVWMLVADPASTGTNWRNLTEDAGAFFSTVADEAARLAAVVNGWITHQQDDDSVWIKVSGDGTAAGDWIDLTEATGFSSTADETIRLAQTALKLGHITYQEDSGDAWLFIGPVGNESNPNNWLNLTGGGIRVVANTAARLALTNLEIPTYVWQIDHEVMFIFMGPVATESDVTKWQGIASCSAEQYTVPGHGLSMNAQLVLPIILDPSGPSVALTTSLVEDFNYVCTNIDGDVLTVYPRDPSCLLLIAGLSVGHYIWIGAAGQLTEDKNTGIYSHEVGQIIRPSLMRLSNNQPWQRQQAISVVAETGHSKTVGMPVRRTPTGWGAAAATPGSFMMGVVASIIDANTYTVQQSNGTFTWSAHGLSTSDEYFLGTGGGWSLIPGTVPQFGIVPTTANEVMLYVMAPTQYA